MKTLEKTTTSRFKYAVIEIMTHFCKEIGVSTPKIELLVTDLYNRFPVEFENEDTLREDRILAYFNRTVLPHKIAVYQEGMAMMEEDWMKMHLTGNRREVFENLLLIHDLSKFSIAESEGYANHDFKSKAKDVNFERAWHHHKMNNPHHPEYWLNPNRAGGNNPLSMPLIYIFEMIADWRGAGKTYGSTLEDWAPNNVPNFLFEMNTMKRVYHLLNEMGIEIN
jgi:hypothetical protein